MIKITVEGKTYADVLKQVKDIANTSFGKQDKPLPLFEYEKPAEVEPPAPSPAVPEIAENAPPTVVPAPPVPQPDVDEPDNTPADGDGQSNDAEFDSAGMPWDERIHSAGRSTVSDGTWRRKRGVSEALVAQVEAEVKSQGVEGRSYSELVGLVSQSIMEEVLTSDELASFIKDAGYEGFGDLEEESPAKIGEIYTALEKVLNDA